MPSRNNRSFPFLAVWGLVCLLLGSSSALSQYSSDQWYFDHEGYEEAVAQSRRHNTPIFIYAYTDWCRFCRAFDTQLLARPDVTNVLSAYVKVRLNPEHGREDQKLFRHWRGLGYPSLWVQSDLDAKPTPSLNPFRQRRLISSADFIRHYALGSDVNAEGSDVNAEGSVVNAEGSVVNAESAQHKEDK